MINGTVGEGGTGGAPAPAVGGAPAPAPAPAAATVDFTTYIPADMANEPSLKMFDLKSKDGFGNLVKSFVSSQKMLGGEKIVIPRGANDSPEAWQRFYEAGGRPKAPTDYKFDDIKLPNVVKRDEAMEKEFRAIAHEMGLSQKAAGAMYGFYAKIVANNAKGMVEAYNKNYQETTAKLKSEWGAQFDAKLGLANKVLRAFGGTKEEVKHFTDRFANEPVVIRLFAEIGKRIEESALVAGETPDTDLGPQGAIKKRLDIMTNKDNPLYEAFHKKRHPRHREAMDEVARLSAIVVGGADIVEN